MPGLADLADLKNLVNKILIFFIENGKDCDILSLRRCEKSFWEVVLQSPK